MKAVRAAAVAVAVMAGTVAQSPVAEAEVQLNCQYSDDRSPSDKLPRPGVIVVKTWTYSPPDYQPYTINDEGKLSYIMMNSHPSEYPLVAAWQNGTSCYGSESSRNAWAAAPDGRVFTDSSFSGPPAYHYGDMAGVPLSRPVVGMSPTSTGKGYWLVAGDGGIFAFGDAKFHGSTGHMRLNQPVTGMAVAPNGNGYWMVAADGGIFAFGRAPFHGSTGHLKLAKPITGMTATPSGNGYWMVASDGGIFAFGDAPFKGSMGGRSLSAPIAGMVPNGTGYTLIGQDGQLYPFH